MPQITRRRRTNRDVYATPPAIIRYGKRRFTISGALRRFKGSMQKKKELAGILSRAKSQLESGKVDPKNYLSVAQRGNSW